MLPKPQHSYGGFVTMSLCALLQPLLHPCIPPVGPGLVSRVMCCWAEPCPSELDPCFGIDGVSLQNAKAISRLFLGTLRKRF